MYMLLKYTSQFTRLIPTLYEYALNKVALNFFYEYNIYSKIYGLASAPRVIIIYFFRLSGTAFKNFLMSKFNAFTGDYYVKDGYFRMRPPMYHYFKYILRFVLSASLITAVSSILFLATYNYFLMVRYLPAAKVIFSNFLLLNFIYLLISGFVFFFKKYRYNRFTSVIQRF
jgi:hypothetical protein